MATRLLRPSGPQSMMLLFLLALIVIPSQALYFYMDGSQAKCFFEDLPKDTLVVGHFDALQYNDATKAYEPDPNIGIYISVEETFDNYHRIVSQRGSAKGRFTF
ncbi:hypothetical protein LTS18_014648, partial [Coniosporium uncinatum]